MTAEWYIVHYADVSRAALRTWEWEHHWSVSASTCPRCQALVKNYHILEHEEWHAVTDFPIPENLRKELVALEEAQDHDRS